MKKFLTFMSAISFVIILCSVSVFATEGNEAVVNGVEYATLQEAIDAAGEGDTVTLLKDLTIESSYANSEKGIFNINSDDKITLDLDGKTINVTDNSNGNLIVFYSYGDFTIKNGTITMTATVDRGWNAQSTILMNRGGNMIIENGTYKHMGGSSMSFTIENNGNSFGDSSMTINGGTITSAYIAVRMRMADTTLNGNPGNGTVELIINGGYIYGIKRAVWGQITNAYSGALGRLDISGGSVCADSIAIGINTDGYDNIPVSIKGNARVEGSIDGDVADISISGGTFTKAIPAEYFAEGFALVDNGDGTYSASVALDKAFTFLGYSTNNEKNAITAGYTVNQELIAIYCEQNGLVNFDFGCAFGIDAINESTYTSFTQYKEYQTFNAKIVGIDANNQKHTTANLMMALYVDFGNGEDKLFIVGTGVDNATEAVAAKDVPKVTFGSLL